MNDVSDTTADVHCELCRELNLKALYQLNIEAHSYDRAAENAYDTGRKSNGRLHSERRDALQSLKRYAVTGLVENGCVDAVERHEIDGCEYYCFHIGKFAFHTPVEEWDGPPVDAPNSAEKREEFTASTDKQDSCMSAKKALHRVTDVFESPNKHIKTPFIGNGAMQSFAGWDSLPGSVSVGDKVPEHFQKRIVGQDFLFDVGDVFQTSEGECEIRDRYTAWLGSLGEHEREVVMQREAYTVKIGGRIEECVRQQRIIDEWGVLVGSLDEPLPGVSGKQYELVEEVVESVDVEFGVGDVVEVVDPDGEGTVCWEVKQFMASYVMVLCEFESVTPGGFDPDPVTVDTAVEKVVAVHEKPPRSNEEK